MRDSRHARWCAARFGLLAALSLWACTLAAAPLVVMRRDGVLVYLEIELARSAAARIHGLMWRRGLTPHTGMLFDFGHPEPVVMWMKNTLIPLDMWFIDGDGRIADIRADTVPESTTLLSSKAAVRYVLEINGGESALLNIGIGDRLAPLPP